MLKQLLASLLLITQLAIVSGNELQVEYFNTEKSTPKSKTTEVSIVMAGDNLIHKPVIAAGKKADGSYDYTYMYEEVKDYVNQFDLRFINQETPMIDDESKYSGYPTFGSPLGIGDAVAATGFNGVSMATNHICDKGTQGIQDSYGLWMKYDIPVFGIHMNEEEDDIWYIQKNDIRLAVVNYTYGTNGISLPSGKEYMIDTFYDKNAIADTLAVAEKEADATIVIAHWGTEYQSRPSQWQREMAQFLADNGADVIFGMHPHVVQPVERVYTEDGHEVPVFWSLGNFISGQSEVPRMLGMFGKVTITKDPKNGTYVSYVGADPVVTHISTYSEQFKVYLLDDYTEELCSQHRLRRTRGSEMSLSTLWAIWDDISYALEDYTE